MVQHRVLEVPKKDCFCFEEVLTVNELFLEQHLNNRFYCQFISEKSILTLPPPISWSWYVNIRILSADWPFLLPFVLSCIDFCFGNALTLFGGGAHLGLANIYHVCRRMWCLWSFIHPSIFCHSFRSTETLRIPSPHLPPSALPGDTKVFPSLLRDTVSSIYPGSALGPPPGWTYPKHPTQEMPMRHPSQMLKPL